MHTILPILGAIASSIGGISYLVATIRGQVQPNKVTWTLWALAPLIAFAAEVKQGVGVVSLITFVAGFFPLLIIIASFFNKKAHWKLKRFDFLCGGLSLLGLLLWYLTKSGNIAILFSILADGSAATPTIIKSYHSPESENAAAFGLSSLGAILTLIAVSSWTFENYAFPTNLAIVNALIYIFIQFKIGRGK